MYIHGHLLMLQLAVLVRSPLHPFLPSHCLVCCLVPLPQVLLQEFQGPQKDQTAINKTTTGNQIPIIVKSTSLNIITKVHTHSRYIFSKYIKNELITALITASHCLKRNVPYLIVMSVIVLN